MNANLSVLLLSWPEEVLHSNLASAVPDAFRFRPSDAAVFTALNLTMYVVTAYWLTCCPAAEFTCSSPPFCGCGY